MSFGTILIGLLVFNGLVVAHEFGHMLAAKAAGLDVPEFAVGFGPRLLGIRVGNTDYVWRLLPLGGYVMLPDLVSEDGLPMVSRSRRLVALLAGPGMNLLITVLLVGPARTWLFFTLWIEGILSLFSGSQAGGALVGLVGTTQMVAQAASFGWQALAGMSAFLSLNFFLFNLLPIPGLDGGRLVGLLLEKLNGGRAPRWEPAVQFIGLLAMLGLGLWVTGQEILRAIGWI